MKPVSDHVSTSSATYSAPQRLVDCLVIGGGPAGLTAAIYLARFHLSVVVVDGGQSRVAQIPMARNLPGFPAGIAGAELLARMNQQADLYGATLLAAELISLKLVAGAFLGLTSNASISARTVLLATGVANRRPAMTDEVHDSALAAGLLRYCPICDGYEITDRPVAILGTGDRGVREAEFLRSYTKDVTLIAPDGIHDLNADQKSRLNAASVTMLDGPCLGFDLKPKRIEILLKGGRCSFGSVYPALGSDVRSGLGAELGARRSEEGCLIVDTHQRTSVTGFYAAGDVVLGLDQISHAMGEGGVAATTIRNDLAALQPVRR